MARVVMTVVLAAGLGLLQGAQPKDKASDYPVHFKDGEIEYGAEYMVRSISHEGTTIIADDYLVVEVAIYPPPGRQIMINAQSFQLRVNGKKEVCFPQAPSIVAASLKYPDWERRAQLEAAGSIGDRGVIVGRPQQVERFPGDQRPGSRRIPNPVPPSPTEPKGVPQREEVNPEDHVGRTALPEGTRKTPVAGHLYFAWKGKLKSIRTVDLLMTGPSGETITTRLR